MSLDPPYLLGATARRTRWGCGFGKHLLPDIADCGMNEKSDVGDRQLGDVADLLVAEIALEFQVDDFALILRQGLNHQENLAHHLFFFETGCDSDLHLSQRGHTRFLSPRI